MGSGLGSGLVLRRRLVGGGLGGGLGVQGGGLGGGLGVQGGGLGGLGVQTGLGGLGVQTGLGGLGVQTGLGGLGEGLRRRRRIHVCEGILLSVALNSKETFAGPTFSDSCQWRADKH